MPYGDANAIVLDMGREILTIVKNTPVLAGVCGTGMLICLIGVLMRY
jgi:predicted TIM-barrel enzyme